MPSTAVIPVREMEVLGYVTKQHREAVAGRGTPITQSEKGIPVPSSTQGCHSSSHPRAEGSAHQNRSRSSCPEQLQVLGTLPGTRSML